MTEKLTPAIREEINKATQGFQFCQTGTRCLMVACLLIVGMLLPVRTAWAVSACAYGGPPVVADNPPTNYAPGAVGDIVWWGPVHVYTFTCTITGSSLWAQGAHAVLEPNGPKKPIETTYPNLQLGIVASGTGPLWYGLLGGSRPQLTIPGSNISSCSSGTCQVTFRVALQLNLRYEPGAPPSYNAMNAFTICMAPNNGGGGLLCGTSTSGLTFGLWSGGATVPPVAKTCGFQTSNVTIPLGSYQQADLPAVGQGTPWITGNLVSTGCTNVTQLNMTFSGTADGNNSSLFQAQGGATGVGIQLQTGTGQQIVPNASLTPVTFAPQPAGGTYPFQARYVRTAAPVNPGPGNAHVTVNITYQ